VLLWLVAMGLDRRHLASDTLVPLQVLGLVLYLTSTLFTMWVFRANSFAAPVVKLQAERAQRVISTGPYAHVRHPMYSGMILFFAGVPLLLGSWWGLAMTPLLLALLAVRILIEERTLREGLPGYAEYAARVRYRLLPGVW
jgi:protein-S-isoprenylcysteine O-methyltransferase Ste14